MKIEIHLGHINLIPETPEEHAAIRTLDRTFVGMRFDSMITLRNAPPSSGGGYGASSDSDNDAE